MFSERRDGVRYLSQGGHVGVSLYQDDAYQCISSDLKDSRASS